MWSKMREEMGANFQQQLMYVRVLLEAVIVFSFQSSLALWVSGFR